MKRHKVVLVGPTPPPHFGPAEATRLLLDSGLRERFELIHLDTSDRRTLENVGRFDVTNVLLALRHVLKALTIAVRHKPTVIYIPISAGFPALFRDAAFVVIGRLFRMRVVLHLRGTALGSYYDELGWFRSWILKSTVSASHRFVVLCRQAGQRLGALEHKVRLDVAPNGLPSDLPNRLPSRTRRGPVRVLYLSNFLVTKGFLEVLKVAPAIAGAGGELAMVGAFRSDAVRREVAAELAMFDESVRSRVTIFPPAIADEKWEYFANADVFAFVPISPEGQPWVVLEAMASALPIVATPQGCIPEMVEDGRNGFIVPPGDSATLADRLVALVEDERLREKMGSDSRRRFLDRFTLEAQAASIERIFLEVMNRR